MANKLYSLVGFNNHVIMQRMESGVNFQGALPRIPDPKDLPHGTVIAQPEVSGGFSVFLELKEGGLYNFDKKPIIVEELFSKNCTPVWKVVRYKASFDIINASVAALNDAGNMEYEKAAPVTPFRLAPNEKLKVISTDATGIPEIACNVRLDFNQGGLG